MQTVTCACFCRASEHNPASPATDPLIPVQVRNVLGQIGPLLARYAAPDFEADEGLSMAEYEQRRLPTAATQGFDLHFLNQMNAFQGLRTGDEIMRIFRQVQLQTWSDSASVAVCT